MNISFSEFDGQHIIQSQIIFLTSVVITSSSCSDRGSDTKLRVTSVRPSELMHIIGSGRTREQDVDPAERAGAVGVAVEALRGGLNSTVDRARETSSGGGLLITEAGRKSSFQKTPGLSAQIPVLLKPFFIFWGDAASSKMLLSNCDMSYLVIVSPGC